MFDILGSFGIGYLDKSHYDPYKQDYATFTSLDGNPCKTNAYNLAWPIVNNKNTTIGVAVHYPAFAASFTATLLAKFRPFKFIRL